MLSNFEQFRKSICFVNRFEFPPRVFKRSFSKRLLNAKLVFLDNVMSRFTVLRQKQTKTAITKRKTVEISHLVFLTSLKSILVQEAESVFLTLSKRVLLIVGQIIRKLCNRLAVYGSYFWLFIILLNLFPHSGFVLKTCVAKNHVRGLKVKAKQERHILDSNPSGFERTVELRLQNRFNFTFRAPKNDNI